MGRKLKKGRLSCSYSCSSSLHEKHSDSYLVAHLASTCNRLGCLNEVSFYSVKVASLRTASNIRFLSRNKLFKVIVWLLTGYLQCLSCFYSIIKKTPEIFSSSHWEIVKFGVLSTSDFLGKFSLFWKHHLIKPKRNENRISIAECEGKS